MKTNAKLIVLVFALMCVFSTPVWPQGFVGKASHNVGMAVTKATTHYVATAHITVNLSKYVRTQTFTDCKVYLFRTMWS